MSSVDSSVVFRIPARGVSRTVLRQFARTLENDVARGRSFCCLITDDEELRRLNRAFREQDYTTDVLSFPCDADSPACSREDSLGEVAISYDRAKQQAGERGHDLQQELQILMLHGLLHLTGLDHERDRGQMARTERRWRLHYGLPAGLIERVQS